ncbi:MAG TPA: hypothetical protein PK229_04415 [Rhodocyclaceae bacterium]|nr:hypothetical protein [Rhodocyclaceae bacterium]HND23537.1 hypothetical protein [Rhodocyclaceae bacterium]
MKPPIEVALMDEVRSCRDCTSLWRAPDRFGPFPLCDGAALDALPAARADAPAPTPQAVTVEGFGLPDPAALRGCRKAPVMIVGINPNLTGFWTLPDAPRYALKGPSTVYARHRSLAEYARAHRYVTPDHHEYRMRPEDVETLIDATRHDLRAAGAGSVIPVDKKHPAASPTGRQSHARHVTLGLQFDDGGTDTTQFDWLPDEHYVTLRARFAAGERIGGVMTAASVQGRTIAVRADVGSSYYARAQEICRRSDLVPGEDISLHDMVACATQGWSDKTGVDRDELSAACIDSRRHALRQIRQSAPRLLIFSGLEALGLFLRAVGLPAFPALGPDVTVTRLLAGLKTELDTGALTRRLALHLPADGDLPPWRAHVVAVPHLSYPIRPIAFDAGVASPLWSRFAEHCPASFALIAQAPENSGTGAHALLDTATPSFRLLSDTWQTIDQLDEGDALYRLVEIGGDTRIEALSSLIAQLRHSGDLPERAPDRAANARLLRSAGPCHFCPAFAVPEGCIFEFADFANTEL